MSVWRRDSFFGRLVIVEITVRETYQPPCECEDQPAQRKCQNEVQQIPAPLDVDERRENIGHVALTTFLDVRPSHVAFAVFED